MKKLFLDIVLLILIKLKFNVLYNFFLVCLLNFFGIDYLCKLFWEFRLIGIFFFIKEYIDGVRYSFFLKI